MRIPLREVSFKENLRTLPRLDLIRKYSRLPRRTQPPVKAFGRRPGYLRDKIQIYDGHHRALASMKRRDTHILAWVQRVNREGRSV